MVKSSVLTKIFWEDDVLEELGEIRIELRQSAIPTQMGSRSTVSLLAGPRGKAPGRIPGRGVKLWKLWTF